MGRKHALVTYRCSDFAIVPVRKGNFEKQPSEVLDKHGETNKSLDDLFRIPTCRHLRIVYRSCHSKDCRGLSLATWKVSITSEVHRIRLFIHEALTKYKTMGYSYHDIHLFLRSWLADRRKCRLAQHQYGIERRNWKDDPFFKPYVNALEHLDRIDRDMAGAWSIETAQSVTQKLNDCRVLVGRIVDSTERIQLGMTRLENEALQFEQRLETESRAEEERLQKKIQHKVDRLNALLGSEALKQEAREMRCPAERYKMKEKPRRWPRVTGNQYFLHFSWTQVTVQKWEERMVGFEEFMDLLEEKIRTLIEEKGE